MLFAHLIAFFMNVKPTRSSWIVPQYPSLSFLGEKSVKLRLPSYTELVMPMYLYGVLSILTLVSYQHVRAANPAQWRERSIYQLITDRFALPNGDTTTPCDVSKGRYCGGTWNGIKRQLDYIQEMGFDAIWISPITKNIEQSTAYGEAYHGYWQQDIYSVNSHFGTPEDLKALSEALHLRGMV
jgi:hypothetical protein